MNQRHLPPQLTLHLFIYIYFHYHTPTGNRGGIKLGLQKIVKFCAVIFYSIIVCCKAVLVFYGYICSIFNKQLYNFIPPQRESIKDYRRITCEKGKYLAKQPQILRNEPTSSQKTMNQTVKTMHRIALVFAMESCMKNA